jgi:uncharacterized membrane protein
MSTAVTTERQDLAQSDNAMTRSTQNGTRDRDGLTQALGWFSIGLGLAQVVAPGGVARMIGAQPDDKTTRLMRAFGLREISSGVGILSGKKTEQWVRARVAGDALDLAMLGKTLMSNDGERGKTIAATVAVLGVTALDLLATEKLRATQSDGSARRQTLTAGGDTQTQGVQVRRTVTIRRPRAEVYAFWRNFENLPQFMNHLESVRVIDDRRSHWVATAPAGKKVEWDAEITTDQPNELIAWRSLANADVANDGVVRFVDAPGRRGTEVHVDFAYDPPGGRISAAIAKLFGEEPSQQTRDDLFALKQVLETGEVVLSDASAHKGPHPAQPDPRAAAR